MVERRVTHIRKIHFNWKAASSLAGLAALVVGGFFVLDAYREREIRREALATVDRLQKAGETDLALRNLNQFLATHPLDAALLERRARLMDQATVSPEQILGVAKAYEQYVRLDPESASGLKARRRVVELYVRFGDVLRESSALYQLPPALATLGSRYLAAAQHARVLVQRGARDPGSHRLLAMALDGLAVPGDAKAMNEAVREYRAALADDPADIVAAERLARLYQGRMKDLPRAERVLDDLLQAAPNSVEVRLARHRFYVKLRRDKKAAEELDAATLLAGGKLSVILAAAEDSLRRGDTADARRQLDKVPKTDRADVHVMMLRGLVDFGEEHPDEAIASWRKGLLSSSGTDAEMTWWLAYVLLQMGRINEATPLLGQYRRLAGENAPLNRFLNAVHDEQTGRPGRAARTLERIPDTIAERWRVMVYLSLGRAYEALQDEMKAVDAYRRALQIDPAAVVARLALAKLKWDRRPADAVSEIKSGLDVAPDDPALRIAMAGALLRVEGARPLARRSWYDFDAAFGAAAEQSPGSTAVALMRTDRLALSGQPDEALRSLEEAARRAPRSAALAAALADALVRQGETDRALKGLDRASAADAAGDSAALRIARASVLMASYRGREARAGLVATVEALPRADRVKVWMAAGQYASAQGDLAATREAVEEWGRLVPEDPRPRLAILDLLLKQGNESAARTTVEELRTLAANDGGDGSDDVAYRLGRARVLLHERDAANPPPGSRDVSLEEAAGLVDSVLSDSPTLGTARMLRAQIYQRQNRPDEAIFLYQAIWDGGVEAALPPLVDLLARRKRFDTLSKLRFSAPGAAARIDMLSAQSLFRAGDASQAARIADQVAKDLPDSAEVLGWQAKMLDLLGRFDDAESALRALAERRSDAVEPWLALLNYQAAHGRTTVAADTIKLIKERVKTDRPELLDARCLWSAGDRAGADKAFQAALSQTPDDVPTLLTAARYDEQTGRSSRAEAHLRRVLKLDPKNRPAARQLATVLSSRAGDASSWEQARALLGPEGAGADAPEDRLARAVVLSRSTDATIRGRALGALDALVADMPIVHPVATTAREYLARLLLEAGQPERASQVASVSAAGPDPAAIALYAQALIQSKKPDAAGAQIDRLAGVKLGDSREAAGLRARLLWDRSRPVEAAAALERAYLARENAPGAEFLGREIFGILSSMDDGTDAVTDRLATKLARKNPSLSWMPASILAKKGRIDPAFELLRTAVRPGSTPEDHRESAKIAMTMAVSIGDADTLQKADDVLQSVLKLDPESDELAIMAAMLRHLRGDYEAEVRFYRQVLARRPEDRVVLNNLAWALSEGVGRADEGLKCIDDLIKYAGRNPEALDTRGMILLRLNRVDDALKDLEASVQSAPDSIHHFHLARAYRRAGRVADAKASRDKARAAGLTATQVDPTERAEFKTLMEL